MWWELHRYRINVSQDINNHWDSGEYPSISLAAFWTGVFRSLSNINDGASCKNSKRNYFHQSSFIDVWQGFEFASICYISKQFMKAFNNVITKLMRYNRKTRKFLTFYISKSSTKKKTNLKKKLFAKTIFSKVADQKDLKKFSIIAIRVVQIYAFTL